MAARVRTDGATIAGSWCSLATQPTGYERWTPGGGARGTGRPSRM